MRYIPSRFDPSETTHAVQAEPPTTPSKLEAAMDHASTLFHELILRNQIFAIALVKRLYFQGTSQGECG